MTPAIAVSPELEARLEALGLVFDGFDPVTGKLYLRFATPDQKIDQELMDSVDKAIAGIRVWEILPNYTGYRIAVPQSS